MTVQTPIALDAKKLNDALACFPRDHAMQIGGREARGTGETIERRSPAHGVVVTRVPRGSAEDARGAIAAARTAFDKGPWPNETASNRERVRKKRFTSIPVRERPGGSRAEHKDIKNREPIGGF